MKRLVTEEDVLEAMTHPPEDTRAYFRGRCLAQYADRGGRRVLGLGDLRHRPASRWSGSRPWSRCAGPRRHVGALIDNSSTAEDLVEALTRG